MNILSPRERILKEVRNSLLSVKSRTASFQAVQLSKSQPDHNVSIDILKNDLDSHSTLWECNNRFHFLDQFMIYLEKNSIREFVCSDKKLMHFFKSCDLKHVETLESINNKTLVVFIADYFEPKGLFTAFNYNGFIANALEISDQIAMVAYKDTMVRNAQVLFERVKNRMGDADLNSVQFVNIADTRQKVQKASFIINSR